jgi:hypothetical protein
MLAEEEIPEVQKQDLLEALRTWTS